MSICAASAPARPNFLVILTDDQGYGDVSTYGASDVRTPHIDRIANEGMRFTGMRANCTVCSPTRAALLTGRYADRVGVPGVIRTNPQDSWGCFGTEVPDQPFFLCLAFNAPYFPIEPPADWLARVKQRAPGMEDDRARNIAFVEHLDAGIGRVHSALDESGLAQNTVVVFTSNNGGPLPHAQNNDPWRGGKQDHYDGGLRVPFMVRWPAVITAGSRSDHAGLVFDLFPTFAGLAGARPASDLDARNLLPVLQGGRITEPRDLYFVRREGGFKYGGNSYEALIRGDWKILRNDPFSPYELYHLGKDPREANNLAVTNRKKFKELAGAIRHHIQRGGITPWQPSSD
jgi:arylsulfatase A-like enzyme